MHFRFWLISEVAARLVEGRSARHSGLNLLTLSFSHFDPMPTFARSCITCLFHAATARARLDQLNDKRACQGVSNALA